MKLSLRQAQAMEWFSKGWQAHQIYDHSEVYANGKSICMDSTLKALMRRGLVELVPDRPLLYRATVAGAALKGKVRMNADARRAMIKPRG